MTIEELVKILTPIAEKHNATIVAPKEEMTEWTIYWWAIDDEDSDLCGEEFFTELKNADAVEHANYAKSIFPNEKLTCYGMVDETEAEMLGLDTY